VTLPVGAPAIARTLAVSMIVEVFVVGFIEAASEIRVGIFLTVCGYGLDEPLEKFASPAYTAVMVWDPAVRVLIVSVAVPVLSNAALPKRDVPSLNVIVPPGVAVPGAPPGGMGTTLTVNVTAWPKVEGFGADVTVTETEFLSTVCERVPDVELEKFPSPE
jgi:hypothetical protein